ncbi:hypothetical protein PHISP_06392 [Aspergillus sp. HF37]|nr:hypothetical protein PHISP_06392 [Aspergillus sp. HF37]
MSAPHRGFSFDRSDNGRLSQSERPAVSPVSSPTEEEVELSHGHPTALSPASPVGPAAPGPRDGWDARIAPTPPSRTRQAATPAMDSLGPAAVGGGIGRIALGIANSHNRLSGIDARQLLDGMDNDHLAGPVERGYNTAGSDNPYVSPPPDFPGYASSDHLMARDSYPSSMGLGPGTASSHSTPRCDRYNRSQRSLLDRQAYPYPVGSGPNLNDGPYQRNSAFNGTNAIAINPDEIADDGDDGIPLSTGSRSHAAARRDAGGGIGGFGGMMRGNGAANPSYGPVPGTGLEAGEKKRWVQPRPSGKNRRRGWLCGAALAFIVVGAIVGGAVGGIVGNREADKETPSKRSTTMKVMTVKESNDDLDKNSPEIQDLMNTQGLHKVFPGVDYTPWGAQYPMCLQHPPSQNNVTRDMAVISQMTNTVRLYSTDCNQTEMVLQAIDRLELKDLKVWLGVRVESDETSNDRQLEQLYRIIDDAKYTSVFKGVIWGNDALPRASSNVMSAQRKLVGYINDFRGELKKRGVDMPVATSELSGSLNEELAEASDVVMSSIRPFETGLPVEKSASWMDWFWKSHGALLSEWTTKKHVMSEVGWPSNGGNECDSGTKCPSKKGDSVAGVDEMNQFMSDWICQALENGTDFFWFEAFDESWKDQPNEPGNAWGLMDASRKLKPGLKIPDCDGKTVS